MRNKLNITFSFVTNRKSLGQIYFYIYAKYYFISMVTDSAPLKRSRGEGERRRGGGGRRTTPLDFLTKNFFHLTSCEMLL